MKVIAVPIELALRRARRNLLTLVLCTAAAFGAAFLIGWGSIQAASAEEENVAQLLTEQSPGGRAVQAQYSVILGDDPVAPTVRGEVGRLADLTDRVREVRITANVAKQGDAPTGLVTVGDSTADAILLEGRRPSGCVRGACEVMSLAGGLRVGGRIALEGGGVAVVVGQGTLREDVFPRIEGLGTRIGVAQRLVLAASLETPLAEASRRSVTNVLVSAVLDPARIRASALSTTRRRLTDTVNRLRRDPAVQAAAPVALLASIDRRGDTARARLSLVTGQVAALVVAFAAFVAGARRSERQLLEHQLETLSASRRQVWVARMTEALLPAVAGTCLALGALLAVAWWTGRLRGFADGFISAALPWSTLVGIAGFSIVGASFLFAAGGTRRRSWRGLGLVEVGALTALGVLTWQLASTGGLSADQVGSGSGASPALLLLPLLVFFVTGVLLMRVLPGLLRMLHRLSRRTSVPARLGLLSAARASGHVAGTTFLGVALGTAVFSLNYLATLDRQAQDEARFAGGAAWRVTERPPAARASDDQPSGAVSFDFLPSIGSPAAGSTEQTTNVAPLRRFTSVTTERPTPVLRLRGRTVETTAGGGETLPVELLGVPSDRLERVLGWRESFSDRSLGQIAVGLRPKPLRLSGISLAPDARAVRLWVRGDTRLDRFVVLHLLVAQDQRIAHVRVGNLSTQWRQLTLTIPEGLRGAELVGVEFPPTSVPLTTADPYSGTIELGGLEQRQGTDAWSELPSITSWVATPTGGRAEPSSLASGPLQEVLRLELLDKPLSLVRPVLSVNGPLPALVSDELAPLATDGKLTVNIAGTNIEVQANTRARLFPTVVDQPDRFVVLDYEALYAVLNVDQPGVAVPSEAWFFTPPPSGLSDRLESAPFRLEQLVLVDALAARLRSDPLAAGTRSVLAAALAVAALLGLLGLAVATVSALRSERFMLAEYEVMGIAPRVLSRSVQIRLAALCVLGVLAGVIGGLVAVRMIGAFVAVTGPGGRPLPPIEPVIDWTRGLSLLAAVGIVSLIVAAVLATRALRETTARRLRA